MRIFVMSVLLLSLVSCGSIYKNNPEYPALKLLKTERDSATGQVSVTVLLTRTPYTKMLFFYTYLDVTYFWRPAFIFKRVVQFRLNENVVTELSYSDNYKYTSKRKWFKLNRNEHSTLIDDMGYEEDRWRLVQDVAEQQEFSFLLQNYELNKKIGLTFYPLINSRIGIESPYTIWADEIPRIP